MTIICRLFVFLQVLLMNHTGNMHKVTEERPKSGLKREFTDSLLKGEYNEEESARSFQEALRQWREENTDDAGETMSKEAMWIPVQPVLVSATATQTDLTSDEVAKGRGSRKGAVRVPVKLEFPEKCLTYTDRLLVKKLCRTPLETCLPLPAFGSDSKAEPDTNTVEGIESDLTAEEEEDFTRYFASLFAVPVSSGRNETLITTPETSLIIEVLDEIEEDKDGAFVSEKGTDSKRKYPSGQQALNDGNTQVPQTARALSSKNKPSSCPTAATPRTSEKSIKTPTSKSRKPSCSPIVHKSEPDCGSQQLVSSFSLPNCQTVTPKSSHFTASFLPDVSPSASATPPIPKEPLSRCSSIPSSLRSTYTVSPSSSTESTLLPTVYQSATLEKGSDSSPLPEQPQSSKLLPQSVSSVRLFQSPTSNLQLQSQSQHSLFDPETLLSHNQLQLTPSPPSLSPNLPPRLLEPTPASRSAAYSGHRSPPINEDAPFFMYFTSVSGDHESAVSQKAAQCSQTVSSYQTEVFQNSPVAVKMDEEEELLMDSGDEISSDSLGLTPHEEESSDEEAHIHRHLMRGRCREKEQRNPGISHPDDPLVDAEKEEFQTNEQEQLSEPTMVIHRQSVGSGSEHFCDLKRFLPLGLDMNSSDSDAPEHRCPDSLHTSRTSMCGSKLGVLRSRSKAAQEIMEICRVDKTGCEDPNLDNDTTSHILNVLDQELKLMTKGTQDSLLVSGNSRSHIQHGNQHFTWGGVSEEQTDEEEAVQRDQQSVLLLP
ncbi:zinc finger B-box domain-containing protein 1 isoform X1 [Xyrichtys novacula]|uniref:Zinc finger B-box domain-containing protein 1 isoform X1 n=1 Tax=Xyrichtys novacula TaxID=13765 RepID=A0AAV1FXQ3_XYRNO|nr:zinc finger B-box domain-containing protein 1 isoform X1 [Xyrichtys novacula]